MARPVRWWQLPAGQAWRSLPWVWRWIIVGVLVSFAAAPFAWVHARWWDLWNGPGAALERFAPLVR